MTPPTLPPLPQVPQDGPRPESSASSRSNGANSPRNGANAPSSAAPSRLPQRPHLPCDPDAERAVLGAVILDPTVYGLAEVQSLQPEEFHEPRHQTLWRRIRELVAEKGEAGVDLTLLCDRLRRNNELAAVGDYLYVATLTEFIAGSSAAPEHAALVREKAIYRRLIAAAEAAIGDAATEARLPDDVARNLQTSVYEIITGHGGKHITTGSATVMAATSSHVLEVRERRDRGEVIGIPTGFAGLDRLLGGLDPGSLNILAARPSIGKTAFALALLLNVARQTKRSAVYYSLEMGNVSLGTRAACCYAGVSSDRARKGLLSDWDMTLFRHATEELAGLPLAFNDSPSLSAAEFATQARLWTARYPDTALFIIDGLWLMNHVRDKQMTQAQRVGETTRILKCVALELGVPILLLHQLNRDPEKRATNKERQARKSSRPSLSDLRDSGAPEQDADVVMFLHRERVEVNASESAPGDDDSVNITEPVETEVFIAKSRNGPIGATTLQFDLEKQRFIDKTRTGW